MVLNFYLIRTSHEQNIKLNKKVLDIALQERKTRYIKYVTVILILFEHPIHQ
jgi:hypothetical protein